MNTAMKKVIVTGATGFIGRFLVRELVRQKVEVIALVRERSKNLECISQLPIRIVECDLSRFSQLPAMIPDRDVDAVFHIAWQGVSDVNAKDPQIQMQNLSATLEILDAMHQMGIGTFVGAGSLHEEEAIIEMAEDKIITNLGYSYKACKMAAHWMGKAKAGSYGIRFFWPLINTYGEEERSARLINTVIRKILQGESPALSAGAQFYDFVHVSDVARALCLIAEKGVDGTNYVIGSGDAKPLRTFLEEVGSIVNGMREDGRQVPLGFGRVTGNVVHLPKETFDVAALYRDTGFVPEVSFEKGVLRTAHWIREEMFDPKS